MLIAILATQLKPIMTRRKSSTLKVMPRPREAPAVVPTTNSGLRSMEKIRIYRAISVLTKLSTKTTTPPAKARVFVGERDGMIMAMPKRMKSKITRGTISWRVVSPPILIGIRPAP